MAAPHPLLLPLIRGHDVQGVRISEAVVASAEEHWVAALVFDEVERQELRLKAPIRKRLAASSAAVEAENLAALASLKAALAAADEVGVEIAVFKGLTTGAIHYQRPMSRPTVDVDVFVDPESVDAMPDLVAAIGGAPADIIATKALVEQGRVFEVTTQPGPAPVDLHRDPMNMVLPSRRAEDRWEHTVTVDLPDGTTIRTLDLEDSVIQALLHLLRDNFADLLRINDVRLMMNAEPDWFLIEQRAEEDGWRDLVRYATWYTCEVLGRESPLPVDVARWKRMALGTVWRRNLRLRGPESHGRGMRRQSALDLLSSGRQTQLAKAYAQRFFPPRVVIDARSSESSAPYPVALTTWRLRQWRDSVTFRRGR